MKTFFLLRHAEAEPYGQTDDKLRALTARGRDDMRKLADYMRAADMSPAHIVYSPARRTTETARIVFGNEGVAIEALWNAEAGDLYEIIKTFPDECDSAALIAHNPGVHNLALFLALQDGNDTVRTVARGYPPGTLCVFECAGDSWSALQPAANILKTVRVP